MSASNTNLLPVSSPGALTPRSARRAARRARCGRFFAGLCKHGFVWLILTCSFLPMFVVLSISLKDNAQFFANPWLPFPPFHWENWAYGWQRVGPTVLNSVFIGVSGTGLTLIFGTCAAYFFARFEVPGKTVLWSMFLALMLMPGIANLIPLFNLLKHLSLLNTFTSLIVVGASAGQVVTIYVLRNFIEDIPRDLFEAAQIDGASHFGQILHVVVPMSGAILSTLAILRFIAEWNSFVLPLVVMRDNWKLPVAVQLYQMEGAYVKDWGPLMASYAIAALPLILIFLFSMRLFVKGLGAGAVKG